MRTLYLDCGMGAAGDMLAAALLELIPDQQGFMDELNALGLPGVCFRKEAAQRCGITGTLFSVKVNGEEEESPDGHRHSSLHDIEHIVGRLPVSERAKEDIMSVYRLIAEAKSKVCGVPVMGIHFHGVGTLDAIADITAVCMLMDKLAPSQVTVSPIHVGKGQVKCAYGILPVPTPVTAYILREIPIYGGSIEGEMCTLIGAALLKHFATDFGDMPLIKVSDIGYGMGKKEFEAVNCVRALLGETRDDTDTVLELSCNVDDMTAEAVGFALECFFRAGALEAYTIPVGMKKSRPGTLINVLCRKNKRDIMIRQIFKHTTTLGIREKLCKCCTLERHIETDDTHFGRVRRKVSQGYGVERQKYEYEDIAEIARNEGLSIAEVHAALGRPEN